MGWRREAVVKERRGLAMLRRCGEDRVLVAPRATAGAGRCGGRSWEGALGKGLGGCGGRSWEGALGEGGGAVFRRVVDSVPTYDSYPQIYGIFSSAKATKEEDLGCSRVASAGLGTGAALMVVPVQKVYRYTLMVVPVQMW
uniref:Uncharacterized protein n=1 Tax=Ananas comosus var. bracteatus TaxID=296719 RepID=A0A6V7QID4_ANACO|nr:unnamed protein product [Ananas comosus var. bracteatus]